MRTSDYFKYDPKYIPKNGIKTARDLLQFVLHIPDKFWCADTRDNQKGQCCVLGHLDNAFGNANLNTDGFSTEELAMANNGELVRSNSGVRIPGAQMDGASIKQRVVDLIKTRVPQERRPEWTARPDPMKGW